LVGQRHAVHEQPAGRLRGAAKVDCARFSTDRQDGLSENSPRLPFILAMDIQELCRKTGDFIPSVFVGGRSRKKLPSLARSSISLVPLKFQSDVRRRLAVIVEDT